MKHTIPRTVKSVRVDAVSVNLIPVDFSMLNQCVAESDLIFESSKEEISVKREIAKQVASTMKKDAISCTGTSGLSITTLAECYPEELRSRFFGVYMFNPPYRNNTPEVVFASPSCRFGKKLDFYSISSRTNW